MLGYKRFRVFPDRDLRATRIEVAIIDAPTFQRLRKVKQLGNSVVAYPTAEHSRFAHSLGTLYWSAKMFSYLKANQCTGHNTQLLDRADQILNTSDAVFAKVPDPTQIEITWIEQLTRAWALTHDITHLPFGHTLEDQAGLLARHDEDDERISTTFTALMNEVRESSHLAAMPALALAAERLLRICSVSAVVDEIAKSPSASLSDPSHQNDPAWSRAKTIIDDTLLPVLLLAHDVVGNTICADLIDYLHRDMLNCGMEWSFDKAVLSHLKILEWNGGLHLGLSLGTKKFRHDVVTGVLGLLRARYDLAEKVYYHHAKCAADALLEKVLRTGGVELSAVDLISRSLGDEEFLSDLQSKLTSDPAANLLTHLRSRVLPRAIYRIRGHADGNKIARERIDQCRTPAGRTQMEKDIAHTCRLRPEAVVISCLPEHMQLKQAKALVEWPDGELLHLRDLPARKNYLHEVQYLEARYRDLWSLTVFLAPGHDSHLALVENACKDIFDWPNDPMLVQYVRERMPAAFAIQKRVAKIAATAELNATDSLNVAFKGGEPSRENSIDELIVDSLANAVDDERQRMQNPGQGVLGIVPAASDPPKTPRRALSIKKPVLDSPLS